MRHALIRASTVTLAALVASHPASAQEFCFDVTPYEVDHSPSCVVQGDLDGDGSRDLVVANHEVGEETISVLFNNGDGTFATAIPYTVAGRPYWVGLGDLDGDLDLDVVVSGFFGHTVSILLNDGFGGLGVPTDVFVGFFPTILTLADFDGDLDLDVACAVSADATVAILLNDGDGSFARPVHYPVSFNPYGVVAADFDGDLALDLAVANYDDGTPLVSLLRNNGDGTFTSMGGVPVSDAPVGIASADLDANGTADLAVTIYGAGAENDRLEVFMGDGAGGFTGPTTYTVGTGPYWIDLADLNDDGLEDVVSANTGVASDGTVTIMYNFGGWFGAAYDYYGGAAPGCVSVGDLDGDGQPELVTTSYGEYSIFVLFNDLPAVASDPLSLTVNEGDAAQFGVTVAGSWRLSFQWRHDGIDLVDDANVGGATTDTLTILAATAADAGSYDVVIWSECGALTSAPAELVVKSGCIASPDIDGDGHVNGADLTALLGAWGSCPPPSASGDCCAADVNADGFVNGADITELLGSWAP